MCAIFTLKNSLKLIVKIFLSGEPGNHAPWTVVEALRTGHVLYRVCGAADSIVLPCPQSKADLVIPMDVQVEMYFKVIKPGLYSCSVI